MDLSQLETLLEPQWFGLLFLIGWLFVSSQLAEKSGWRALSEKFPVRSPPEGQLFRTASGVFGESSPIRYNGILYVTVTFSGVGFKVALPFRFGHREFFLPWSAIESVELDRPYFRDRATMQIRNPKIQVVIYGRAGKAIAESFKHVEA